MRSENRPSHGRPPPPADQSRRGAAELTGLASHALVIGLDVLEFISRCSSSPTVAAIAAALGVPRSVAYRSIVVLEDRGYIVRTNKRGYRPAAGPQQSQLMAQAQRRLLAHATPVMQALCDGVSQSCNIAVPAAFDMQVIARQDSPGPFGINVPLGFGYDVPASAPGLVFAAFTRHSDPNLWPEGLESAAEGDPWSGLKKAVKNVTQTGFAQIENTYMPDIIDLSCPIFDRDQFVAALTVPYMRTTGGANMTWCLATLQQAAERLNDSLDRDALAA